MNILIQLLVAVIVFLIAQWLLSFTGVPNPLALLIAVAVAVIAFFQSPALLNR